MARWLTRRDDAPFPFQNWTPFPPEAIVQVRGRNGSRIAVSKDLWWGYAEEMGDTSDGVILRARRLDRPKERAG